MANLSRISIAPHHMMANTLLHTCSLPSEHVRGSSEKTGLALVKRFVFCEFYSLFLSDDIALELRRYFQWPSW